MIKGFYIDCDGDAYRIEDGEVLSVNGFEYDWSDDDDDEDDCDWGYNEDEGFDPYEGCYSWDC